MPVGSKFTKLRVYESSDGLGQYSEINHDNNVFNIYLDNPVEGAPVNKVMTASDGAGIDFYAHPVQTTGTGLFGILTISGTITASGDITTTSDLYCADLITTGGMSINRVAKTADYTITSSDYLIGCDSSGGVITITLPTASTVSNRLFYIVDETGSAATYNITITTQTNDKINGSDSYVINTNYTSINLYSDGGTGYHII
jgi:hypothetical protein